MEEEKGCDEVERDFLGWKVQIQSGNVSLACEVGEDGSERVPVVVEVMEMEPKHQFEEMCRPHGLVAKKINS